MVGFYTLYLISRGIYSLVFALLVQARSAFIAISKECRSVSIYRPKAGWLYILTTLVFIPRREIRSISSRGPIEVSFHLLNFGLERVYWTSKTYMVYRVFLRENVLSPEGRYVVYQVGVQLKYSFQLLG